MSKPPKNATSSTSRILRHFIVREAGYETDSERNATIDHPPLVVEIPAILDASKGRPPVRHKKQRQQQDLAPESGSTPGPRETSQSPELGAASMPSRHRSWMDGGGRVELLLRMPLSAKETTLPVVARGRALSRCVR
jgi:hypothetical protein